MIKREWFIPIALALVSLLVSGWVSYNNTDRITASRIAVVETQQHNNERRLERIENKVDRLLDAMYRDGR